MTRKRLIKGLAFVLIFAVLFAAVSKILVSSDDYRNYQWIAGFYEEPEDSLDAVYIGSSTGYAYWNSLVAWDRYGIAVYPYTNNSQHLITVEYLIKEVRKTQPNALFIVNTNSIDDDKLTVEDFHYLLDNMPFSLNKLQLTNHMVKTAGMDWEEALELYVPMYRYHDRWSKVNVEDFINPINGLKGASDYDNYFKTVLNIADAYTYSDGQKPLPDYISDAAVGLMDYCEKENVKILFVTVPRVESEDRIDQLNTLNAMLEERGFDTLNLLKQPELCDLDLTQDYYNNGHTNIHGSIKYTNFLSAYLIEHYGFTNKHGEEAYASWDAGWEKYAKQLHQNILELELNTSLRTTKLEAPENLTVSASGSTVSLSWSPVEGAKGYELYRKLNKSQWEYIGVTAEHVFEDTLEKAIEKCAYTVVPFMEVGDQTFYGKFPYKGVKLETQS